MQFVKLAVLTADLEGKPDLAPPQPLKSPFSHCGPHMQALNLQLFIGNT